MGTEISRGTWQETAAPAPRVSTWTEVVHRLIIANELLPLISGRVLSLLERGLPVQLSKWWRLLNTSRFPFLSLRPSARASLAF